jgi:Holliday junction resolvasome RuvABC endonuclease subunit
LPQNKLYLTLDPALCTGYCISDYKSGEIIIIECGIINLTKSTKNNIVTHGQQIRQLYDSVKNLIIKFNIGIIGSEDYVFSKFAKSGANLNVKLRAAIELAANDFNLIHHTLPITEWKKSVAGRAIPTKEQKALYGKGANKEFIVEALVFNYKLNISDDMKRDTTDAIGMMIFMMS